MIAAADAGAVEWQVNSAASAIAQTLVNMRDPTAQAAYDRLKARFGWLYVVPVDPVEPYRAPPHPRRTVPRWSFELEAVDEPIVEPVSKFGGQPVWIGDPTWPLSVDGAPTTFMAQFTIPGREGLAYLFLDAAAVETDEDWAKVIVQPGPVPVPFLARRPGRRSGPRWMARNATWDVGARGRSSRGWCSRPVSTSTTGRSSTTTLNAAATTSATGTRSAGTLAGCRATRCPTNPGGGSSFSSRLAKVGHELADGAEVYGLIHDDGRGRFIVHSH